MSATHNYLEGSEKVLRGKTPHSPRTYPTSLFDSRTPCSRALRRDETGWRARHGNEEKLWVGVRGQEEKSLRHRRCVIPLFPVTQYPLLGSSPVSVISPFKKVFLLQTRPRSSSTYPAHFIRLDPNTTSHLSDTFRVSTSHGTCKSLPGLPDN